MSNPEEKKPIELKPIETRQEVYQLITEGAQLHVATLIWTKTQDSPLQTRFSHVNAGQKEIVFVIPKNQDLKGFLEDVIRTNDRKCFFCLTLPKFNLLFQTKLTRENEKHFYFEFPSTAYKVQRRDHFRLTIPSDFSFWIEFESPTLSFEKFKRKAIDMSAGGMSFRSEASDTTQLKIGITLKNLQFTLRDRLILTDAKIKYHKPIQNPYRFEKTEDQYKIGLQFITLPAEKRELIASYVFEQNRKLYARYLS